MSEKLPREEYFAEIDRVVTHLESAGVSKPRCFLFRKLCEEVYEMERENAYFQIGKRKKGHNFHDKPPAMVLDDVVEFFVEELWKPSRLEQHYQEYLKTVKPFSIQDLEP